jgi:hypothetical protein
MISEFNIGDAVAVLDDVIEGYIVSIKKSFVKIETKDGFDLEFEPHELVKIDSDLSVQNLFSSKSLKQVISEKSSNKKSFQPAKNKKEKHGPIMEVDLHLHHLVKNEKFLSSHEKKSLQLDTAQHKLEFALKNNIQKIVFIHGVGEGVLKLELAYLFNRYDQIKFYDADYKKYGLGATEVYVFQNKK